jgi:3-hydroxymyristoyl/3-hydroxydecanoyl-(acyl carrier protein) dehydratase
LVTEPQILSLRREAGAVRISMRIPSELSCLEDHFPGTPIVPGVVLLKWALDAGRREFALPPVFKRLSAIKFMRIMPLDREVTLDLQAAGTELSFAYFDADRVCVQGRVAFTSA